MSRRLEPHRSEGDGEKFRFVVNSFGSMILSLARMRLPALALPLALLGQDAILRTPPTAASGQIEKGSLWQTIWFNGRRLNVQIRDGQAFFEGDMILGSLKELRQAETRKESVVWRDPRGRWPDGIVPYEIIPSSNNSRLQNVVQTAMQHWEQRTGFRFRPRQELDRSYVRVVAENAGCYSYIGRQEGPQVLNLASSCEVGSAIHELGHSIGLFHEQSRADRDQYIQINEQNIVPDLRGQFAKGGAQSEDTGFYDYASIMHYSDSGFSSNGRPTISTLPEGIPIGQRAALSYGDIDAAERLRGVTERPVVIASHPDGLTLTVDGATCTSPCRFDNWANGSTHSIAASSPQRDLYFARWSDSGAQTHNITANSRWSVYTANFSQTPTSVEGADLRVRAFTAADKAIAGQETTNVAVEIVNEGSRPASPFRLGLYISTNSAIDVGDRLIASCSYASGLNAGASGRCDGNIGLPADLPSGQYFIGAIADDQSEVVELNELNNAAVNQAGITAVDSRVSSLPDLAMTSFDAPVSIGQGSKLEGLSLEARNLGSAAAGKFRVGFYFSSDVVIDRNDAYTGYACTAENGLNAGGTYTCSGSIEVPTDLRPGTYYLGIIADDLNEVTEANEDNNGRVNSLGALTVAPPNAIDLVITSFTSAVTGTPGGRLSGTQVTLKNQGSVGAPSFRVGFYLSSDSTINTDDVFTGSTCVVSAGVGPGAMDTCTAEITLPSSLSAGTYYLGAIADDRGQVAETDEGNNTLASQSGTIQIVTSALPDLVVESFTAPTIGRSGTPVANTRLVVRNIGSVEAGPFEVGYYISTDAAITKDDTFTAWTCKWESPLLPGDTLTCTGEIGIPENLTSRSYFLGALVDRSERITESNESNNGRSNDLGPTAITGAAAPDLTILSIQAPSAGVVGGRLAGVKLTVGNQGSTATRRFRVAFYLSTSNQITAQSIATDSVCEVQNGLAAPGQFTCTTDVRIPANLSAGTYYLGAIADDRQEVAEANEGNNIRLADTGPISLATTALPDLAVVSFTGPLAGNVGGRVQGLRAEIRNQGTAAAGRFRIAFYISPDTTVTSADTYTTWRCVIEDGLAVAATKTCTSEADIPANLTPGRYYLGVIVDDFGEVAESNEDNNSRANEAGASTFTTAALADLTVVSFAAPTTGTIGERVDGMKAVIRNDGSAPSGPFRIEIYLSKDQAITSSDVDTTWGCDVSDGLNPGATWTCSGQVGIPGNIAPGQYYFGVIADSRGQVVESQEGNNAKANESGATSVAGPAMPDLTIKTLTGPTSATIGTTLTNVQMTIANTGKARAGRFTVAFYYSKDQTITASDIATGWSCTYDDGLDAGAQTSCSGEVGVPANIAPGTYYLGGLADPDGKVAEQDEGNNGLANQRGAGSLVTRPLPDLTVASFTAGTNIIAGGKVSMAVSIRNTGNEAAGPYQVAFMISRDREITADDFYTGWACDMDRGLAAESTDSCSGTIEIPANLAPGKYFLGVFVDSTRVVVEANEDNNFRANDSGESVLLVQSDESFGSPDLPELSRDEVIPPSRQPDRRPR